VVIHIKGLYLDSKYDSYCCLTWNVIVLCCLCWLVWEGVSDRCRLLVSPRVGLVGLSTVSGVDGNAVLSG
jgi:hypothetical protein